MNPTIKAAAVLAASVLGTSLSAQDQEELIQKREDKLAAAWLTKASWITDYDAARAKAAESGKVIFAYFTRSYSF